ncbi:MAG: hypothetical protein JXA66_05045 [Oligoflexia bacterium]|nr:hypothetical protein [Oligoflexia bacterium]
MQKIRLSLSLKVAVVFFTGVLAVFAVIRACGMSAFRKMIENEFRNKAVKCAEYCMKLSGPRLVGLYRGKEGERTAARDYLNSLLKAGVDGKDIIYAAIVLDGEIKASSGGKGFVLPEVSEKALEASGYRYYAVKGRKKTYELRMPLENWKSRAGTIRIGFDMSSVAKSAGAISGRTVFFILAGSAVTAAAFFLYFMFFVVIPVRKASEIAYEMSEGRAGSDMKIVNSGDEVQVLTESLRDLSLYMSEIEGAASAVAKGKSVSNFRVRSEKDSLGKSFSLMLEYIDEISGIVKEAASLKLKNNYTARSDDDALGKALEKMGSSMKKFISEIKDDADIVASSSELLKQISDQSQGTIAQLAGTIGAISTATAEAAKNSQTAAETSTLAREAAKKGGEHMSKLLEKMNMLNEEITVSTKRMEKLAQHSEEIKKLAIVIKGIADETKLLSFNAAIEAARAGEAGRGFVIVAEEIRKLSDLSTEQAVKISQQVKEVRQDMAGAIEMVSRESESIRESAAITNETGSIFSDIEKYVDKTADNMNNIAATSEEIAASSEESAAAAEEQSGAMQEMNACVAELADISRKLKEESDKFEI